MCLFMFVVSVSVFGVASLVTGKRYWRFGIGFGLAMPLMAIWLCFIAPVLANWAFPLLLFIGVPITIVGLGVTMLSAVGLGMWLYGKDEENNDATGKQID